MDELYDLCGHVLGLVMDELSVPPADSIVSVENPPDDCCDFAATWVSNVTPTVDWPSPAGSQTRCRMSLAVTVNLKLVRRCWPTNPVFPAYADVEAAALALLTDAQEITCALTSAQIDGRMAPPEWGQRRSILNSLTPLTPSGGCAGWLTSVEVDVPICCAEGSGA